MASPRKPLDVIIVGGSLTALMHGIILQRLGHNIHILEQLPIAAPTSHTAGIFLSPHATAFVERVDSVSEIPLGSSALAGRLTGFPYPPFPTRRIITSWGALYFRLMANFDGISSVYIPHPPDVVCMDGEGLESARNRAVYEHGQRVVDIRMTLKVIGLKVSVIVEDLVLRTARILPADLVLGVDRRQSTVREIFLFSRTYRSYSGYVAWRGVVPESELSEETREAFQANVSHIWSKQVTLGTSHLAPAHAEVLSKIRTFFIHAIIDSYPGPIKASFFNGRVLLVGDALAHLRPHGGYSTSIAALEAEWVGELVSGEISLAEWEGRVTRLVYLWWCRGIWYGHSLLRAGSLWEFVLSTVWYWAVVAFELGRAYVGCM
ncbi:hypothetical protein BJX62DRAFT_244538 [Aspergillus germanicus]